MQCELSAFGGIFTQWPGEKGILMTDLL